MKLFFVQVAYIEDTQKCVKAHTDEAFRFFSKSYFAFEFCISLI